MDIISSLISIGLISGWWLSEKLFYLGNIITFCMIGSFMKWFKFMSFKSATIFLTCVFSIDALLASILYFTDQRSYNSIVISDFNTPFLFQVPGLPT